MTARREKSPQRQAERRLYVSRPLTYEDGANALVAEFANRIGRSIKGTGRTRSVGSMAVTLLSAQDYSQVRNNLSSRDRAKHVAEFDKFTDGLKEVLRGTGEAEFCIHGLGFMGRNARSYRPGAWITFGLKADRKHNERLEGDIKVINDYFDENNLSVPPIKADKLHIAVGEVQIHRLETGKNHDPHIFIPAGVVVPQRALLQEPQVEDYDG